MMSAVTQPAGATFCPAATTQPAATTFALTAAATQPAITKQLGVTTKQLGATELPEDFGAATRVDRSAPPVQVVA